MITKEDLLKVLDSNNAYSLLAEITNDLNIDLPNKDNQIFYMIRMSSIIRFNKSRADHGDALEAALSNFIQRRG